MMKIFMARIVNAAEEYIFCFHKRCLDQTYGQVFLTLRHKH